MSANKGWAKEYNLRTQTFDLSYIIDEKSIHSCSRYINFPATYYKCNPLIKQFKEKHGIILTLIAIIFEYDKNTNV